MVEVTGNLWTFGADIVVITTNGTIKKDGSCVMGRGCAAEAKDKYPRIPFVLGASVQRGGNHAYPLLDAPEVIVSFPVKHQWYERADPILIEHSAKELVLMADILYAGKTFVMPRPGCGNGHLDWKDVHPIIAPILDDRFHVITW